MAEDASDAAFLAELERESKEFNKDGEIARIINAFRLNAYELLELHPGVPESDIKVTYRKKSLLIHPDKTSNPLAPDAFDRLNKAQVALLDEKQRAELDEAYHDARQLLIREHKWTVDSPELKEDNYLRNLLPKKVKEELVNNEMRRVRQRKGLMQEEGRQRQKEEDEIAERKRKREYEKNWEDSREQRMDSWRKFQKTDRGVKHPTVNGNGAAKNGDAPTKNGDAPSKNGDAPSKNGDAPSKNGDAPKAKKMKAKPKPKMLG